MAAKKKATKKKASKKTTKKAATAGRPRDERSIPQLIDALKKETDEIEKRKLRAKLRARGHEGGAGLPRGRKPAATKTTKKTAKRKKAMSR